MTDQPQDATPQDAAYLIHELDHLTHTCPVDGCETQVSNLEHLCDVHGAEVPEHIHAARRRAVADRSREGFDAAWFAALAHIHTEVAHLDLAPEWERHGARAARARDAAKADERGQQDGQG